jgi:hypothetical protein
VDEGFDAKVPRELWVEARGRAPSLDDALDAFYAPSGNIMKVIGIVANAATGSLHRRLAFSAEGGDTEHEFAQDFFPLETGLPRPVRNVSARRATELISAIFNHPECARLHRAVAHYDYALQRWDQGEAIIATNHLFIAAENLKHVALERERQRLGGLSDADLAARWGIAPGPAGKVRRGDLEAHARREVIFRADKDTHDGVRDASDGFEHGYETIPRVHQLASSVRDTTAHYIRQAIFELAGLDEDAICELMTFPYDQPRSLFADRLAIRGVFFGPLGEVALDVGDYAAYPMLVGDAVPKMKALKLEHTGEYSFKLDDASMKVSAPSSDFSFQGRRIELWGESRSGRSNPQVSDEGESE